MKKLIAPLLLCVLLLCACTQGAEPPVQTKDVENSRTLVSTDTFTVEAVVDGENVKYRYTVFDLDGTLVNTLDDLAGACKILLKRYDFDAQWTMDDYRQFVGNGLKKLVERAFDHTLSEDELNARYAECKEIYDTIKLDHAHAYDGIKEQLGMLKEKGVKLCVVTNKFYILYICHYRFTI